MRKLAKDLFPERDHEKSKIGAYFLILALLTVLLTAVNIQHIYIISDDVVEPKR